MSGVTITCHAYGQLLSEAGHAADGNETGGLLLGCDRGMGSGFVVQQCGDPGPNALRGPANFQRDLAHARMLAETAAKLDGSVWIGEWHTHLIEMPTPSGLDLSTYRILLRDQELNFLRLLSIIVLPAHDGNWSVPRIFAWSVSPSSARPIPVMIERCSEITCNTCRDEPEPGRGTTARSG
jgi:integrative and conjugative element protein (TIGR02256 family)